MYAKPIDTDSGLVKAKIGLGGGGQSAGKWGTSVIVSTIKNENNA